MARLVWFVRQQGDQLWICRTVRELFCGTQSFVDNAHLFPVHSLFINIIVSNWIQVSQVEWKFYWATMPWETLLFSRYSSNTIIGDISAQGKNHKYMNFSQIFIGILLKMVWKYDYVFFGMYIFRVWSTLFSKLFPHFLFSQHIVIRYHILRNTNSGNALEKDLETWLSNQVYWTGRKGFLSIFTINHHDQAASSQKLTKFFNFWTLS